MFNVYELAKSFLWRASALLPVALQVRSIMCFLVFVLNFFASFKFYEEITASVIDLIGLLFRFVLIRFLSYTQYNIFYGIDFFPNVTFEKVPMYLH